MMAIHLPGRSYPVIGLDRYRTLSLTLRIHGVTVFVLGLKTERGRRYQATIPGGSHVMRFFRDCTYIIPPFLANVQIGTLRAWVDPR